MGTPGCIGGQLDSDQPCFAHSDDDGRAAAMRRLRDGISLDFLLGAEVTEELLAEVLAAAPTKDGRKVFPFVDLRGARLHSSAGFDGVSFEGPFWSAWSTFQGDAGFFEASFQRYAWFGGATFRGDARFGGASFADGAWFDRATFQGNSDFHTASFGRASGPGRPWFGEMRFQGPRWLRRGDLCGHHQLRRGDL
jgi:hypothetical protein